MSLTFTSTADNSNYMESVQKIASGVKEASSVIEGFGTKLKNFFGDVKDIASDAADGFDLKGIISKIVNTRAEFQKLETAFTTFLGSEEAANTLMNQLTRTASFAPFDLSEIAEGARTLLAFGVEVEDVNQTILTLGDIAGGLSKPLGDLISMYGSTIIKPTVDTKDIEDMMGEGIPIIKELAKQFDVAEKEVLDFVEAGKVSGDAIKTAFQSMTAEGSMFGGYMEAQSKTISGQIAGIESAFDEMFNEIGKTTEGIINFSLEATSTIVENWRTVLLILADVAASYGVQKAYFALDAGFNKAKTNYGYDVESEQLRALLPVKEEEAKSSLDQAVASGALTEAKAKEIESLREQANAQLDTLKKAEDLAKKEAEAAAEAVDAHDLKTVALEDEKQSWLDLYDEAINAGDAETAQAIATEIAATEVELKESADVALTLAEEARTAATNVATASEARETLETQINTAQTASNTAATGILTIAKEKLALAMEKVNVAMKANQFALVMAGVVALGYAVYKCITYQTDFEKATIAANEASTRQMASMYEENRKLDELKDGLDKARKGTDEWREIKNEIVSQYGQYLDGLDAEIEKTGNLRSSYNQLTKAIRLAAAARAMQEYRETRENDKDYQKDFKEALQKTQKVLSGTFLKRDGNGNIMKDKKGNPIKFKFTEEEQRRMQALAYDYMTTGNFDGTDLDKIYMQAGGLIGGTHYGAKGVIEKPLDYRKDTWKEEEGIAKKFGFTRDEVDGKTIEEGTNGRSQTKERGGEAIDKDIQEQKKELKKHKKGTEEWKKIDAKITELIEERKEFGDYDRDHRSYNPRSSRSPSTNFLTNENDAQQKLADLMRKQAQERLRIDQDYEFEHWQNRINLMEEGEKKILAQQQLNNSKELTELKRRQEAEEEAELQRQTALFNAEQERLASGNRNYTKKAFRDSDIDHSQIDKIKERYKSLEEDLLASQKKSEQDRLNAAKESMNTFLKEYGTYSQKRKAIQEEYSKRIKEAPNAGERRMAMAQRNQAEANLDFEEWQENGDLALAFGDVSKLSKTTIAQLISDMETYRKRVVSTFDPDKIKKYEEAMSNLTSAFASADFSFGEDNEILNSLRERISLQKQLADADANETELLNQKRQIEEDLKNLTMQMAEVSLNTSAVDPNGNSINADKDPITEEMVAQANELRVKLLAVSKSLDSSTRNSKQLRDQLSTLGKVKFADIKKFSNQVLSAGKNASELAGLFSDDVSDGISEATDKLGGLFDAFITLSSNIEALAKSGKDAVEKTAKAGEDIVDASSAGMKASANATSASLTAMEKASAILAIIGAAIQVATLVASLVNPDKKHEKNIERLQEQIDELDKSYERLGKSIDKAYSTEASELIGEQNTLLEQQKVLIEQQLAEEEAKKKSDSEKVKEYKERLEEIEETIAENKEKAKEAIIGEDLKGAIDEFAGLYAEAWNDGTDAAQKSMAAVRSIISSALTEMLKKDIQPTATKFYDALAEAMEDGILTDAELKNLDAIKAEMDAVATDGEEQWKKIQERYKDLDELREELTDISYDSVRDNFKSLLSDMESSTADFTDSFTDMLRNALIEGLMSSKYDRLLDEWYMEFADAMENGELSDSERGALRQKYESIVEQGITDRDAINSIVGGGAYSQSATSGGWASMGQDTAEELNGRFTTLTELNVINNSLVSEGNMIAVRILETLNSLSQLSMMPDRDDSTLSEIRDMMFLSTGHLEDISKYTRQLITIRDGIDRLNTTIIQRL